MVYIINHVTIFILYILVICIKLFGYKCIDHIINENNEY